MEALLPLAFGFLFLAFCIWLAGQISDWLGLPDGDGTTPQAKINTASSDGSSGGSSYDYSPATSSSSQSSNSRGSGDANTYTVTVDRNGNVISGSSGVPNQVRSVKIDKSNFFGNSQTVVLEKGTNRIVRVDGQSPQSHDTAKDGWGHTSYANTDYDDDDDIDYDTEEDAFWGGLERRQEKYDDAMLDVGVNMAKGLLWLTGNYSFSDEAKRKGM